MIGQGNVAVGSFIPTTMASTDHDDHIHPTDLSPRSSIGSGSPLTSDSHSHSSPSPNSIKDELSPLQRLQFAVDKNTLFSNLFNGGEVRDGYGHSMFLPPSNNNNSAQRDSSPTPSSGLSPNLIIPTSKSSQENTIIGSPIGSPNSDPANIFQCPLCSIVCNGRHSFNEHLVTHSQHHACPDPKCDYLTTSEDKLRDHIQEAHDFEDSKDGLDEDETAQPKVNSQGKVKTFKCKQCEHVSVTKKEFWSHSKSHIRTEKMLKCPKCDFVTEYKHHLEYHVRNHVGSKPFQCNSCSYTCVNKSMLNSHLKSHSAVYQYRCADCSYATKYCHSLKLHLRKYSHNPSMVLNPDGTPNPLPIIDVYGTRRGPKMKKPSVTTSTNTSVRTTPLPPPKRQSRNSKPAKEEKNVSASTKRNYTIKEDTQVSPGRYNNFTPPISSPSTLPSLNRFTSESSDSDNESRRIYNMKKIKREIPMSPKTPNTGMNPAYSRHSPAPEAQNVLEQLATKNQLELYAAALKQYLYSNPLLHLAGQTNPELAAQLAKEHQEKFLSQFLINQGMPSPMMPVVGHNGHNVNNSYNSHASSLPLDLRHQKSESLSPSHSQPEKKRNRKGKALRYERSTMDPIRHQANDEEDDENEALDFSNNNNSNKIKSINYADRNYTVAHEPAQSAQNSMMCKYCEISFPDPVLYRMHMSYHSGDMDPFLCKSCGKKTKDKVAFFLHLTTDSH